MATNFDMTQDKVDRNAWKGSKTLNLSLFHKTEFQFKLNLLLIL